MDRNHLVILLTWIRSRIHKILWIRIHITCKKDRRRKEKENKEVREERGRKGGLTGKERWEKGEINVVRILPRIIIVSYLK